MQVYEDYAETSTLCGVTVLDFCMAGPGLYVTQLMRRFGARVLHFEPPGGDPARQFPEVHLLFNAGKESVVVDLKTPDGRALAIAASRKADILIEGWRPGVAARLGIGAEVVRKVNPAIVYCSLSGYGQTSPLKDRPGHDINYLAASGLMSMLCGESLPTDFTVPLADIASLYSAAVRVLAALLSARESGRGMHLDVSIAGAARDWLLATSNSQGLAITRVFRSLPHYGVFKTEDGEHLTIGNTFEEHFWSALCRVFDIGEFASLSFEQRILRAEAISAAIGAIIKTRRRREWEQILHNIDICWAFVEGHHGAFGIGGTTPGTCSEPPQLGEHTEAVRLELTTT